MILHAGLVACFRSPRWRGVLIEGPWGAGKSDLALRAIAAGWVLVADDRTVVWTCDGCLYGRSAEPLTGLIEARGLGVWPEPARAFAKIDLIATCVAADAIERTPERAAKAVLGLSIPRINLAALEPSAPVKLARALTHLGLEQQRAYQADRASIYPPGAGGVP